MTTNPTYYYDNNYEVEKEYRFSGLKLNLYGLVFAVLFVIISDYLFRHVVGHPCESLLSASDQAIEKTIWEGITNVLFILGAILLGIFIHECIHAICFAIYNKEKFKSVQMGVIWKYCMPYARCPEPISVKYMYVVGLMPALLLGILPMLIALYTGNYLLWSWGTLFTVASGGDFMLCWQLLKLNKDSLVGEFEKLTLGFVLLKTKQ